MLDFKDVDKSDFECWQLEGGSVYYGQVAYVDQDNRLIKDIEEAKRHIQQEEGHDPQDPSHMPKFRRVRHGLGINCYGRTEGEGVLCKYEGHWDRDQKHGEGYLVFPDGSSYEGSFKHDVIDGYGLFEWKHKGHKYEGNWKDGRMEGGGEFTHGEGNKTKGSFFNNYQDMGGMFINPFMSQQEAKDYMDK